METTNRPIEVKPNGNGNGNGDAHRSSVWTVVGVAVSIGSVLIAIAGYGISRELARMDSDTQRLGERMQREALLTSEKVDVAVKNLEAQGKERNESLLRANNSLSDRISRIERYQDEQLIKKP